MAIRQLSVKKKSASDILDDLRVRFFRLYPNLPLAERDMPCIVLNFRGKSEPLSWRVCYQEIRMNTGLSKQILHWLGKMEFI